MAIQRALAAQFDQVAPGAAWVRSQSEALVSNVEGVVDRQIASPASNIAPVVDADVIEWLRLGAVTVEPM
ncbi:hypothetical protein D3C86_2162870 [compost metagenome]